MNLKLNSTMIKYANEKPYCCFRMLIHEKLYYKKKSKTSHFNGGCIMTILRFLNRSVKVAVPAVVISMILLISLSAAVKNPGYTNPELRLKWYQDHTAMKERSLFKNLPWQFLGPLNISGRMTDAAVVTPKGKHYTIYAAGASGGVWKTENEGTTWEPIFQHAASTAIGDIALAPTNQDIVWVGTGEANIFRSSQAGAGIYKSIDAGKTWQHMGLAATHTIPRIIVHPGNPDIVYVAASGHEWTENPDRGLYKTIDGGKTWEKIFYVNEKTGVIDLAMDPSNPDILYISTWQRMRKKWNDPRNEPDYTGSGILTSTDAGKTWKPINNGLPEAKFRGRIGIDIFKSNPDILYAFVDNYEIIGQFDNSETDSYGRPRMGRIKGATVYRSDNKGETWTQVSVNDTVMQNFSGTYGWVFGQIRVDPNNDKKVFLLGVPLGISEDGGKSFRIVFDMHGDHHGLWVDPANSNCIVNVNDGGMALSYDGGKNWRSLTDNFPLVQFFNIAYDMAEPFHVFGSVQDHGSFKGVVDLKNGRSSIPAHKWDDAPGGEGSSHAIDPRDPNIVYSAGFYGNITRSDLRTGDTKDIVPKPAQGEAPFRGQWLAPFILSPHDPNVIYHGMNFLFRSKDRGDTWEKISPDLTYNDSKTMGDIPFHTIFTISESPFKAGLIYVGTDDGRAHVTRDFGKTWTEIIKGTVPNRWVSRMVASSFEEGTVYMSQNGKRDDDFTPYLWKSADYGKTWKSIVSNIPLGPINVIREDPDNKNILYVGTDAAVYVSLNGGKEWNVLGGNLPTTYVHDLVIHPRDRVLVAATHGRGAWAMDVGHLRELTPEVLAKNIHTFDKVSAKLPSRSWMGWWGGINADVWYYLKPGPDANSKTPAAAKLTIKDDKGNTIVELKGNGDTGLNLIQWNLTKTGEPVSIESMLSNPYVEPGKYKYILTVGENSVEGIIDVAK